MSLQNEQQTNRLKTVNLQHSERQIAHGAEEEEEDAGA